MMGLGPAWRRRSGSVGAAIAGFVVVVLAMRRGRAAESTPASWRNDLLGPLGRCDCLGFVGSWRHSLGLAFGPRAAHVTYPATIGCAGGGVVMALVGPALMG